MVSSPPPAGATYQTYAPPPSYPPPPYYPYAPPPRPAPPPEPVEPSRPGWALGAGVAAGDSVSSRYFGNQASFPNYRIALERRLGSSTWLTLNAALGYLRTQQPVSSIGNGEPSERTNLELHTFQVGGLLGLRQVLVHSVVDVSLVGAIGIAHGKTSGDEPRPEEYVSNFPGSYANTLGFVGGFAAERQLIEGLALRLSVTLLSATTSRAEDLERKNDTVVTTVYSTQSLDLFLSPALYLFFYF